MVSYFASVKARLQPGRPRPAGPYPEEFKSVLSRAAGREALAAISAWRGYAETPLVALVELARETGVAKLFYKQEAGRFGLGSFKALGGAYAVYRLLAAQVQAHTGEKPSPADILSGRYADIVAPVTVTCATDGNHGRSVAWGARMFGCQSVVFVHETVSKGREDAIAAYGARVVRTKGNYDDSVREAARVARENDWRVVSDTSYPGYTEVPRDVMQGYSVMVDEAGRQLGALRPTHVFIQGGVGGLAAAVTAHFWEILGRDAPKVIVVEPDKAACLLESAVAGKPTAVEGDLDTIMAGLACGEPSIIAWPILEGGVSAFITIPDETALEVMRLLASGDAGARLVAGESGVAGLAGFLVAAAKPEWRAALGIDETAVVVFFGSEGDTDPELYKQIVGKSGAEVRAEL